MPSSCALTGMIVGGVLGVVGYLVLGPAGFFFSIPAAIIVGVAIGNLWS